jgi:hypothetical protein
MCGRLIYNSNNLFNLSIILPNFLTTFCVLFGLPHPSIVRIFQCVCTHPIDPMNIHLIWNVHGNEHIGTHDIICDTFVAIA